MGAEGEPAAELYDGAAKAWPGVSLPREVLSSSRAHAPGGSAGANQSYCAALPCTLF
jgi:hypothetical protein